MTQSNLLLLELKLLLIRHGRQQVLRAMAEIENVNFASIEQEIAKKYGERSSKKVRTKPTADQLLGQVSASPEIKGLLASLIRRYEAREFLPQLRDVKRFFESRGLALRSQKSRQDALPTLVKTLASLSLDELRKLVDSTNNPRGDLGILAERILRGTKTPTRA